MGKYVDLMAPFCVWTAQAGTDGGSDKVKNLRRDLYKKFCSCGPIAARLPYAIATKKVPLCGFLRLGINKPLRFAVIDESTWDSIYRRSLPARLRGEFAHASELCGKPVVFPKGDTMKEFLGSRPAEAVFPNLIEHMNLYTVAEYTETIDSYARMPGWATSETKRGARNLPEQYRRRLVRKKADSSWATRTGDC